MTCAALGVSCCAGVWDTVLRWACHAVLGSGILCFAGACCDVLYCAVSCCAGLWHTVLASACYGVLCHIVLRCGMLCIIGLCYAAPCHAGLCCIMLCCAVSCCAVLPHVVQSMRCWARLDTGAVLCAVCIDKTR